MTRLYIDATVENPQGPGSVLEYSVTGICERVLENIIYSRRNLKSTGGLNSNTELHYLANTTNRRSVGSCGDVCRTPDVKHSSMLISNTLSLSLT